LALDLQYVAQTLRCNTHLDPCTLFRATAAATSEIAIAVRLDSKKQSATAGENNCVFFPGQRRKWTEASRRLSGKSAEFLAHLLLQRCFWGLSEIFLKWLAQTKPVGVIFGELLT
jgi:hypothetical protein